MSDFRLPSSPPSAFEFITQGMYVIPRNLGHLFRMMPVVFVCLLATFLISGYVDSGASFHMEGIGEDAHLVKTGGMSTLATILLGLFQFYLGLCLTYAVQLAIIEGASVGAINPFSPPRGMLGYIWVCIKIMFVGTLLSFLSGLLLALVTGVFVFIPIFAVLVGIISIVLFSYVLAKLINFSLIPAAKLAGYPLTFREAWRVKGYCGRYMWVSFLFIVCFIVVFVLAAIVFTVLGIAGTDVNHYAGMADGGMVQMSSGISSMMLLFVLFSGVAGVYMNVFFSIVSANLYLWVAQKEGWR